MKKQKQKKEVKKMSPIEAMVMLVILVMMFCVISVGNTTLFYTFIIAMFAVLITANEKGLMKKEVEKFTPETPKKVADNTQPKKVADNLFDLGNNVKLNTNKNVSIDSQLPDNNILPNPYRIGWFKSKFSFDKNTINKKYNQIERDYNSGNLNILKNQSVSEEVVVKFLTRKYFSN